MANRRHLGRGIEIYVYLSTSQSLSLINVDYKINGNIGRIFIEKIRDIRKTNDYRLKH